MRFIIAVAILIQPCSSHDIGLDLKQSHMILLFAIVVVLALSYIFYPAYASLEGSLNCTDVILVEGVGNNHQGATQVV